MYWPPVVWWQWIAMVFLPGFNRDLAIVREAISS